MSRDVEFVPVKRKQKSACDIEEGNVVVSRNDNVGCGESGQIRPSPAELSVKCSLCQVAANSDKRRRNFFEIEQQRLIREAFNAAEM